MNIGILGGTFDPIHLGHIAIAEEARDRLALDKVIFIPAGQPWLKAGREITPAQDRAAMVKLAISRFPYFVISMVEIDHPGPSYTSVTLADLEKQFGKDANIYFILGWDSLNELPNWHEPSNIVRKCFLVAITRNITERPDLDKLERIIPGVKKKTILLDIKPIDISSTEIRHRASRGLSLERLVPETVEKYIKEKKLYSSLI